MVANRARSLRVVEAQGGLVDASTKPASEAAKPRIVVVKDKPVRRKLVRSTLGPRGRGRVEVGSVASTLRHPIRTAKAAVRKEAATGAREAVMPWVMLSVGLSLYALSRGRR